MKPKFWLERWQKNQIGFHQEDHNPFLVEFWPTLNLRPGAKVFVPLCGKSLDMRWLEKQGHEVVGVELAQLAIENYFVAEDSVQQESVDRFVRYTGQKSEIYHGDFFDLTTPLLSGVDAVFDRGALVALPPDMRFRYVDHMLRIIPEGCRILLITLEYDQNTVSGPPHAVHSEEVEQNFGHRCDVELVESFVTNTLAPHFEREGVRQAVESVYAITKRE
ncbi:MAG: thiopurine S-methyltransferase [Pseudomonadales bacterium]|nr:thiopurine S-methyltransferase [Pseudomonadales bacterium]